MKIKSLCLENFRAAKKLEFDFHNNKVNLFVGINGAGKSSVLDAIAISLSWLINRIHKENSSGKHIPESSIRNGENDSLISIEVDNYTWMLFKSLERNKEKNSELAEVSNYASKLYKNFKDLNQLPIVVHYPVDRVVGPGFIQNMKSEDLYSHDVYENALGGKTNFQSFFDWFKNQEDMVNEERASFERWISNNKLWIRRYFRKINKKLEQYTGFIPYKQNYEEFNFIDASYTHLENADFIFHELRKYLRDNNAENPLRKEIERIIHDIHFYFNQVYLIAERKRRQNDFNKNDLHETLIDFIATLDESTFDYESMKAFENFQLEVLVFSMLLSFWWLDNNSKKILEKQIRLFFRSIRNLDLKLINKKSEELTENIEFLISKFDESYNVLNKSKSLAIDIVKKAVNCFLPEFTDLRIERFPKPRMIVNKNVDKYSLEQLSDGEKNFIALIGDIARRLFLGNPFSENPLEGQGVVLIDEIDLHLHPKWQRNIIEKIQLVFPNVQFFITTHSPQVISSVRTEEIYILKQENGKMEYSKPADSFGLNTDRILEDIMEGNARPVKAKEQLDEIFDEVKKGSLDKAKELIDSYKENYSDDPELAKANVLIKRFESIGR